MGKYMLDGKSVDVNERGHAYVEYSKPNSDNKLRVSFCYRYTSSDHDDTTHLDVTVEELKPKKLNHFQTIMNRLRPNTYSETQAERLEYETVTVYQNILAARGGGNLYGDEDFFKHVSNVDFWYDGKYKEIVLDAQKLALKGMSMDRETEQLRKQNNQVSAKKAADKKMSDYLEP